MTSLTCHNLSNVPHNFGQGYNVKTVERKSDRSKDLDEHHSILNAALIDDKK